LLNEFAEQHNLGIVVGEAGMVRVQSQVRMPDVAFYSWRHFPGRLLPEGAILGVPPDLAVEILSPSNTRGEMARKRREYFGSGTQLIWEIFPPTHTAHVYTDVDTFRMLDVDATLDGATVLPGFAVVIRTLFDRAGQRATPE
jgi:Uma2 family endonuclease